jgi:hypothetical protein
LRAVFAPIFFLGALPPVDLVAVCLVRAIFKKKKLKNKIF